MLNQVFYEITFIAALCLLPFSALTGDIWKYCIGLVTLYVCLRHIRKYQGTFVVPEGKSVFISGCDSGFGHALSLRLHNKGFRVFAGCLFPEGEGATTLKEKCPDNLFVVPLDVTKDDSVKKAEQFVREHLDDTCVWGLVNNAGVFVLGDIELTSLATYKRVFEVNVFGTLRVTKAFLPLIRESTGRVVVLSSVASLQSYPGCSGYGGTKATLEYMSDCLRMEMLKFGVKVSIIEPSSFAKATNVFNEKNVQRLLGEAVNDWEMSSEVVKQVYRKEYSKINIRFNTENGLHYSANSMDPVINAIQRCLVAPSPPYRTIIHGGPFGFDAAAMIFWVVRLLPSCLADWIMCKLFGHSDTRYLQSSDTSRT